MFGRWRYGVEVFERGGRGRLRYVVRGYIDEKAREELKKRGLKNAIEVVPVHVRDRLAPGKRYLLVFFKEKRKKGRIRKKKTIESYELVTAEEVSQ